MSKMTTVTIGRNGSKECMEFAFDDPMGAYIFYTSVCDHYREDDLAIEMTEEKEVESAYKPEAVIGDTIEMPQYAEWMPKYAEWLKNATAIFGGDMNV